MAEKLGTDNEIQQRFPKNGSPRDVVPVPLKKSRPPPPKNHSFLLN
jgi:hypothetical protein